MDHSTLSLAGLACHLVAPARAEQVVVLCHGYGAPGTDLVPLAWELEGLSPTTPIAYLFPEAPLTLGFGGRAWWEIDIGAIQAATLSGDLTALTRQEPAGLQDAAAAVGRLVAEASRVLQLAPDRITLGGFSQGAILSTEVALIAPVAPRGLCILSGLLLAAPRWKAAAAVRGRLPVFQSHGLQDPILPLAGGRQLRQLLVEAGLPVTWVEFDGGHGIPPRVLAALARFLAHHA